VNQAFSKLLSQLKSITVESKFIFILNNGAYLVNPIVNEPESQLVRLEELCSGECELARVTLTSIERLSNKLRMNLQQKAIHVPGHIVSYMLSQSYGVECNWLGSRFAGSEQYCLIQVISDVLNFTAVEDLPGFPSDPKHSKRLANVIKNPFYLIWGHIKQNPNERVTPLSSGLNTIYFGFLLIIDKLDLEMSNPLRAFDLCTWVFLVAGFITLSLVFSVQTIISINDGEPFLLLLNRIVKRAMYVLIVILGAVLEQGQPSFLNFKKIRNNWCLRSLFIIWLISCIVLSNGYKGVFFSLLAICIPPPTPSTLDDLIESKYPIVAIDSFPIGGPSDPFVNVFSVLVGNFLNDSGNSYTDQAQKRGRYTKALNKTVLLTRMTYGKVKVLYDQQIPLPARFTNVVSKEYVIPKTLGVTTSNEGVEHLLRIMKTSGNYFLIRCQEYDNFISTKEMFVVTRNFFFQPFNARFTALIESGMFEIWRKYSNRLKISVDAYMMACMDKMARSNRSNPLPSSSSLLSTHANFCSSDDLLF